MGWKFKYKYVDAVLVRVNKGVESKWMAPGLHDRADGCDARVMPTYVARQ